MCTVLMPPGANPVAVNTYISHTIPKYLGCLSKHLSLSLCIYIYIYIYIKINIYTAYKCACLCALIQQVCVCVCLFGFPSYPLSVGIRSGRDKAGK